MSPTLNSGDGKLIVAVAFDDKLETLLQTAESLCLLTGLGMRLIHVNDPWMKSAFITAIKAGFAVPEVIQAFEDDGALIAKQRLQYLASTINPKITVETALIEGDEAEVICRDARDSNGAMILVGSMTGPKGDASSGYATAVSLASESPVPVLIINESNPLKMDSKRRLRLMVADDLRAEGQAAIKTAFALATALGGADILHCHVHSLTPKEMKDLLINKTKLTEEPYTAHEEFAKVHRSIEATLKSRVPSFEAIYEDQAGHYRSEVLTGDITNELHKAACAFRADIVLYGQHQTIHKRSAFLVGKVPFKAMLAQNHAVIVVPVGDL